VISSSRKMRDRACVDVAGTELLDFEISVSGSRDALVRPTVVGLCGVDFNIVAGGDDCYLDRSERVLVLKRERLG
jgi:threonine dehydrogenase-like Zn-dependent dehydrogenase